MGQKICLKNKNFWIGKFLCSTQKHTFSIHKYKLLEVNEKSMSTILIVLTVDWNLGNIEKSTVIGCISFSTLTLVGSECQNITGH